MQSTAVAWMASQLKFLDKLEAKLLAEKEIKIKIVSINIFSAAKNMPKFN